MQSVWSPPARTSMCVAASADIVRTRAISANAMVWNASWVSGTCRHCTQWSIVETRTVQVTNSDSRSVLREIKAKSRRAGKFHWSCVMSRSILLQYLGCIFCTLQTCLHGDRTILVAAYNNVTKRSHVPCRLTSDPPQIIYANSMATKL